MFRLQNLEDREPLEDLGVDGSIVLKYILMEQDENVHGIHLTRDRIMKPYSTKQREFLDQLSAC